MSVRPSIRPCAKVMYTKTQEPEEIIVFLFESCILGIETANISTRTHEDLRSQSRMKFLTTLLYLGNRLIKSIQTFFISKVWTRKKHKTLLKPIAQRLPKLEPNEVLAEQVKLNCFSLLKLSQMSLTLIFDQFTKITEVCRMMPI